MSITCTAFAALKVLTASLAISGTCPVSMSVPPIVSTVAPGTVITLDFSQAKSVLLNDMTSYTTVANFKSTGATYSALNCRSASHVTFISPKITGPGASGITATLCDHLTISNPMITGSLGDGLDFAGSQYVTITGGGCWANVVVNTHPDCVQAWAYNGVPASHYVIRSMAISGPTQGIDNFGDNTGDTDWQVHGNTISTTGYPQGIAIVGASKVVVTNNTLTGGGQVRIYGCDAINFYAACADAVVSGNVDGAAP